jgi:hypothetical protein
LGINLAGWERIELRRLLPPFPDVPPGQLDDVLGRAVRAKVAELPPGLRSRAARVVAAAEAVLAHEALSPWGWMVYYSALASFEPVWTGELRGEYTRDDPSSEAAKTKTKREDPPPEPAAPGSGGGGPTTGGG